jgi:hypothetical protein
MSKNAPKYPGLADAIKGTDIAYMTAYQRLNSGWSFERATTVPTHRAKPKIRKPRPPRPLFVQDRRPIWERSAEWVRKPRKQYIPHTAEDTSPPHIGRLRAAFCNDFIRTGVINTELQTRLKEYADECRAAKDHPKRVSAEHEPRRHCGRQTGVADNRAGGGTQTDAGAARALYDYLRS